MLIPKAGKRKSRGAEAWKTCLVDAPSRLVRGTAGSAKSQAAEATSAAGICSIDK